MCVDNLSNSELDTANESLKQHKTFSYKQYLIVIIYSKLDEAIIRWLEILPFIESHEPPRDHFLKHQMVIRNVPEFLGAITI